MSNTYPIQDDYLGELFKHILHISSGECGIDVDLINNTKNEQEQQVLTGLLLLHEDLEYHRKESLRSLEADYQVKVLKERNEELAQFNYVASHHLQEPLRLIQSFTKLLEESSSPKMSEEEKTYFSFIQQSSKRTSELIAGLFEYSKIGENYTFEKIDSQQIVQNIILEFDLAENINIQVDQLPKIIASKYRFQQLFKNLLNNALKFQSDQNNIQIQISCNSNKEGHTFSIKDNGIGIDPKNHEKVFKIFQRLHTTDVYEGTGIGLALCKKIVEMHKGKIWINSELNEGANFLFFLPNTQ